MWGEDIYMLVWLRSRIRGSLTSGSQATDSSQVGNACEPRPKTNCWEPREGAGQRGLPLQPLSFVQCECRWPPVR